MSLYKAIKPIWTQYSIELWGCTSLSNISDAENSVTNTEKLSNCYILSDIVHNGLVISCIRNVILGKETKANHDKLTQHSNLILTKSGVIGEVKLNSGSTEG